MNKKNKILIILSIIVLIIISLIFLKFKKVENKEKFETAKIEKLNLTEYVTASGTINPVSIITIGTQVSGTIKEIYVDYNSQVKKGQLLALIDPDLLIAKRNQELASVNSAKANLEKLKATLANNERTMKRQKELFEKDFIAKSEFDNAETEYLQSKAEISSAVADIEKSRASLRNAETNLQYTRIISPVDGIVISRNVDIGQTVAASFQTPTLFEVAKDLTEMQIEADISEADIAKIKENQDVEFIVDAYPDDLFVGKVTQVRLSPTTLQNVVTYTVIISINNKDLKLKPGMTANLSIIINNKKDVLAVPNKALRFTLYKGENAPKFKQQGIWIIDKENKPKRINIETGITSSDNYIEIISTELKEGDTVILGTLEDKNQKENKNMPPPRGMF